MADKTIDFAHVDAVRTQGASSATSAGAGDSPGDATSSAAKRGLQPPEFLVHMSAEERAELETKLKRKIDLRLMPAIILMVRATTAVFFRLTL